MTPIRKIEWTEPRRFSDDNPYARISRCMINGVMMGSVVWFAPAGPYYGMTQVRRLGAYERRDLAEERVELNAEADVASVPTAGSA